MVDLGNKIRLAGCFHVSTDYLLGQKAPSGLDVSGLNEEEIYSLKMLISAIKNHNKL